MHFIGGSSGGEKPANRLKDTGACEITIESGAEASVWPRGWLQEEPTVESSAVPKRLVEANGEGMGHHGS